MGRRLWSQLTGSAAATAMLLVACSADPSEPLPPSTPAATEPAPAASTGATPTPSGPPAQRDPQGELNRSLIKAAWANDRNQARRLIQRGADVNAADETQQSAFLIAASEGYPDLLELTLASGADVKALDSFNGTALIRAAERGHAAIVGRLLQTSIDVDHVNRLGWTALHEAVWLGNGSTPYQDTVRLLVAAGSDVDRPARSDGRTPLRMAEERGFDAIATTLRTVRGATKGKPNAALLRSAKIGNADRAALALRQGAELEARDDRGRTPLLLAAATDNIRVARLLVALGADPDALDDRHDSPWLVTGVTGSVAMADLLLTADPDLTLGNRFGGISIIPAAERGHVDYLRRVLKTPINVNHVNDLGWTALHEAVILGDGSARYVEVVTVLLRAGADPRIADSDGLTALDHAKKLRHGRIAEALES